MFAPRIRKHNRFGQSGTPDVYTEFIFIGNKSELYLGVISPQFFLHLVTDRPLGNAGLAGAFRCSVELLTKCQDLSLQRCPRSEYPSNSHRAVAETNISRFAYGPIDDVEERIEIILTVAAVFRLKGVIPKIANHYARLPKRENTVVEC